MHETRHLTSFSLKKALAAPEGLQPLHNSHTGQVTPSSSPYSLRLNLTELKQSGPCKTWLSNAAVTAVQTKDVLCVDINEDDAVIRNYGRFASESVQTTLSSELNKRVDSRVEWIKSLYKMPFFPLFFPYCVSLLWGNCTAFFLVY